jgi:hypothetical protein
MFRLLRGLPKQKIFRLVGVNNGTSMNVVSAGD